MENLEEINKSVTELFDMVIQMWKGQNMSKDSSTYFTFFPNANLFELDFPIFEKNGESLDIIDWVTYSFINKSVQKSYNSNEFSTVDITVDYSIERYPQLTSIFAKYLTIVKQILNTSIESPEYGENIEKLRNTQVDYMNLYNSITFEHIMQNKKGPFDDVKVEIISEKVRDYENVKSVEKTNDKNIINDKKENEIKAATKDETNPLVNELKEYLVDKEKYNFTINSAVNKLNYVSDKSLELAINLIKKGNFSIKKELDKYKRNKIYVTNTICNLCSLSKNENYTEDTIAMQLAGDASKIISSKSAVTTFSDEITIYNNFSGAICEGCKYEKCPKAVATLIVYYLNKGELEAVLKERKEFREKNIILSPYFDYTWVNKTGVKEMTDEEYAFCEALIQKKVVSLSNILDKDKKMTISAKLNCKEMAIINNRIENLPSDDVLANKKISTITRKSDFDTSLCGTYICNLNICPFVGAAYIYYMKKIGKEDQLKADREYYHENKETIDENIKAKVIEKKEIAEKQKKEKFGDFEEYEDKIDNLDSVLDMIVNKNQKNLHLLINGDNYSKDDFVKKITKALENEKKIKGVRRYSLQQFAKLYAHTENKMIEDEASIAKRREAKEKEKDMPTPPTPLVPVAKKDPKGVTYSGKDLLYFASVENDYLYILDNISEFIDDFSRLKSDKNISNYRKALLHAIESITEMMGNNYFIIEGNSEEIDKFLGVDPRIKFVYQNNIVVLPSMSIENMFDEFLRKIDPGLLQGYRENETQVKNNFEEYVVFARKFMPFDDIGLINYLATYSNQKGQIEFPPNAYKKETLEESLKNIVGLDSVKKRVKEFEKYMMFQIRAKANNIKIKASNMHMIFTGNPGTGKTTVARIMAKMLYDLGLIEENKLVEVERKDLIAEYIGQTAMKTSEVIDKAMGGVLFIDEAYTLAAKKGSNDFGAEAIATLIKAMEDHKDKFVVIFAGYRDEMKGFLDTNPGISSRIGYTFDFEDYNTDELIKIFEIKAKNMGFELADDIYIDLRRICDFFSKRAAFGNGRFVDKVLQETIMRHSLREDLEQINVITREDIPTIEQLNNANEVKTKKSAKETLNGLIGLKQVKAQMEDFEAYVRFVKKAEENGLTIPSSNLHMIFAGNPGTGKTTVARIIAQLLYEIGVIHENKLLEVERKDLVGQYVGETAIKTNEVIERALGGVLFIDEAYSLANGHGAGHDLGAEAVATLIKAMEDHKNDLVVIFAGYTKEMGDFLNINPGIASRVGYTFNFEDYNGEQLLQIFEYKVKKSNMKLADGVKELVLTVMKYFHSVEDFGNGRFVDKFFARVLLKHAKNEESIIDTISTSDIPTIKEMTSTMLNGKSMIDVTRIDEKSQQRTAYHEAGHAGVRYLLKKDPNIVVITINAEGKGTLGYVRHKSDGSYNQSKQEFLDEICELCAGRIAEEVFCGDYETGWWGDLETITNMTRHMITKVGMSDLGLARISNPGAELEKMIYDEQNKIISSCLNRTKELIENNKQSFMNVANYLIEHKEINEEEFKREFDKSLSK